MTTLAVFTVNRGLAILFAIAALLLVLLAVRFAVGAVPADASPAEKRRRGLGALVVGFDGRVSTSKTQAVLWTFAVFFAITFMMVWGRSVHCGSRKSAPCTAAANARKAFDGFVDRGLQAEYFVLMGFPIGVAIAAKAITTSQVEDAEAANADSPKKPLTDAEAKGGVRQGLREIVANDDGEIDLLDAQYFGFNLLALGFFFVQFLAHPVNGLPDLPPTLIALAGVSAAGYTTKKALGAAPKPASAGGTTAAVEPAGSAADSAKTAS